MKLSNIVNTALYLQGGHLHSVLSAFCNTEAEYALAARKHLVRVARRCYGSLRVAAQYPHKRRGIIRVLGPKGKLP